jgi:glycine/sarcosine N-methyltransferase
MNDPFALVDYSRLIDWPTRLAREWPFLAHVLSSAPVPRVLDLGCGTGEHGRLLASRGFGVVGIDASAAMLARARERTPGDNPTYVSGDITDIDSLVEGEFGGAICLGNTLPHVATRTDIDRLVRALRARLLPGAPALFQLLNYDRIFATGQRTLPTNVIPDEAGALVLVRLMDLRPDGHVIFTPATCRYRPEGDPPLEILSTRSVWLRGWRQPELEAIVREGGFDRVDVYGTMEGAPFDPRESGDLVLVAR